MSHAKVHDSLQAEITLQSQIFSNSQMSAQTTIARMRSLARLSGGFFNKLRGENRCRLDIKPKKQTCQ